MTSLKRSQTERVGIGATSVIGPELTIGARSDDFYARRFRTPNGTFGSASTTGPPRSESAHHVGATPSVPKMGVRARIADWPPRKDVGKDSCRTSDQESAGSPDGTVMSIHSSSPNSRMSQSNQNSLESLASKRVHSDYRPCKAQEMENLDSRFLTPDGYLQSPAKNLRRIRQRSNSDITISELDVDGAEEYGALSHKMGAAIHREYGSTSSIDKHGMSGDSFFDLLKGYRNEQTDQRSPAPEQLNELLKAEANKAYGSSMDSTKHDSVDGFFAHRGSPRPLHKEREKPLKRRSKSETGDSSIFRKLRNAKGESELGKSADFEDSKSEDSVKNWACQKCFAHYDVQSVLFDLNEAATTRHSVIKRRNTTTGASAAAAASLAAGPLAHSISFSSPAGSTEDLNSKENLNVDYGDEKSNELVLSCSYFRNEIGGEGERKISLSRSNSGSLSGFESTSFELSLSSHCTNAGVAVLEVAKENLAVHSDKVKRYIVEHVDLGAYYYRKYFYQKEHSNYFGVDENLGPVAVSIRREKLEDSKEHGPQYNYRIILRTSELTTLRGSVLEDAVPSTAKHGTARGIPMKEVLEFAVPELSVNCLRLGLNTPKVTDQLMKLDEQGLSFQHKVGVMYCKAGQSTEEEMYNNEVAGSAFEEFLQLLGDKVRLKGFGKYRAQLDTKTDSTGTHSLYTTYKDYEIMFHVSTLLPYTPNNKQQLLRKRHIGNDIVTIVLQEPGAMPFTPKNIRSHFQHVFVIVRVHNPCTENVCYSVAVARSKDVPAFGPPIPKGVTFPKSTVFRDFLLAKVINAENAAHKSEKFRAMATRTRQEYLKDLAENSVTNTPIDPSGKFPFISLATKKKEKSKPYPNAEMYSLGTIVWNVHAEDYSCATEIDCLLGISNEFVVLIEESSKQVVFNCSCRDVIGWTSNLTTIKIFYERGECIFVRTFNNNVEEIKEIIRRLEVTTKGCETVEMTLRRNALGQLGFHVNYEGIVADVEPYGYAWQAGLRQGSRLVEICKVAVATLTHEQMIDLLRTSVTVKVIIIPPHEDSTPRRGCSEMYRMPVMEYKVNNEGIPYEFKLPFRNSNKWQRGVPSSQSTVQPQSQTQSQSANRMISASGSRAQPQERNSAMPRSASSDGRSLDTKRLISSVDSPYVSAASVSVGRNQHSRNSPSNLSSSSDAGSGGGSHRRQKSIPEGFGLNRRSPGSVDRLSFNEGSGSGKSTPIWQKSEDSNMEKTTTEPTWHIPSVSKVTSALRDSPSGRLVRQEVVDHVSPVKHGQSDAQYSSHSSSNTLSSNASSAHSDEKWYDTGDRMESELNGYNYIQGTSADSGIDTTSYGPCHGSMLSAGTPAAPTNSLRSAPTKEKAASPWPGSNDSGMHCSRLGDRGSHSYERRGALSPAPSTESQSRCYGGLVHSTSSASAQEGRAYSLSDTSSQSSTLSSRHSISPVVFTHSRSSPHDETQPTPSPQASHHSSSTSGPRTFYPRQGATSKYLIGWKKPEGTTINSVGFVDSRNFITMHGWQRRHHSDVCEITQTRLRASVRDLRSPQRSSKSTIEDDLKKLINLESPPPDTGKDGKPSLPGTPTTRKPLHRTLSDESIYSGQREPSYSNSHVSLLDQALPNDVIFSSTYPSLHYTLPGRKHGQSIKSHHVELSASDGSLSDIHERRRQPLPDPGLMPLPDTAMGLEWSNLVDAAKAFEVQRASLFGVDDSDHRPDSLSLDSSSQADILSSPQAVSRREESPTTLSGKVTELEMLLKELQDDLRRAKEDRAALQAEVQHLREDNLRLQEESQTASAQLKKFTEWVFNTIDMK
ncbi:signal-induced proliferation-associated 1-like protein 1 isoform X1 [Pristis pectinata]|uniref:signal-induced proliferation-associated 1-like protein 1 isoform X1 n=1 Tax=Pristis pectinata TaxID=685728 RepID=UPI00223CFF17|nr:signal-induced proliferation-associated 1-like protein 1 isoform X1 [Pristis pectinata]XP_051895691.1 signal-induced proliferation-associated 1-like protein 1 isoform X1 [Pristis pectinata]XP_051895779.1 signal-induced proliferation-associated 1-like protein 1 isoform X1 [Pristis pectinata]XP_051895864.1 signal-induced proliferation-associated 1-like protein 1 isoform X1 [Pristis pectinata]XP_051895950.1 signal-induced proliferation-associated 1-like protein 1 isoform X1 [Pristis pectinata]